jgi:hypothetical protein
MSTVRPFLLSSAAAGLPKWRRLIFRLPLKVMASPLRFPAGKFPSGGKCHANRKSYKIVKARLENCCLGRIGGCGRHAIIPFALFFL